MQTLTGQTRPAQGTPTPQPSRWPLPEGWPLIALFALYPLWWALGLGPLSAMVLAVPMAWQLWWSQRRMVVPVGTGLYLALLGFMLASGVMIGQIAPGTDNGDLLGTVIAFGYRFASCLAAAVVLMYVSSSDQVKLPTSRVINALSALFVATVVGGWLGLLLPAGAFTSPLEHLMPPFVRNNDFAQTIVHPGFSQIQNVLGYAEPRPKAPFEYSNTWGFAFSLLLPFHLLACRAAGKRWVRLGGVALLVASMVPVVLSLNRGLWVALGLSVALGAIHQLRCGRPQTVVAGAVLVAIVGLLFAASPLATVASRRLDHPHSNAGRAYLYSGAARGALASPLLGWGGPRQASGSAQGISTGVSAKCPTCGTAAVGTQGTFWTLLFSTGIVATGLWVSFFVGAAWRSGRKKDPLAAVVTLVLILLLFEQFVYDAFPMPLVIAMTGIGLIVRRSTGPDPFRRPAVTAETRSRPPR